MEKLWTTSEVARYLGVSDLDVEQLVRDGKLSCYRLAGRFLRFRPEQVKQLKEPNGEPRRKTSDLVHARAEPWQGRLWDALYFYDFYIVSALILVGLVVYLMVSG